MTICQPTKFVLDHAYTVCFDSQSRAHRMTFKEAVDYCRGQHLRAANRGEGCAAYVDGEWVRCL